MSNHDNLLSIMYKNNKDLLDEAVDASFQVIYSWNKELHDTNEICKAILVKLGDSWVNKLEALLEPIPRKGTNAYFYRTCAGPAYLQPEGRDRTRTLKYLIKEIITWIYRQDTARFKYYRKYNPKGPTSYRVYKDILYKKSKQFGGSE